MGGEDRNVCGSKTNTRLAVKLEVVLKAQTTNGTLVSFPCSEHPIICFQKPLKITIHEIHPLFCLFFFFFFSFFSFFFFLCRTCRLRYRAWPSCSLLCSYGAGPHILLIVLFIVGCVG